MAESMSVADSASEFDSDTGSMDAMSIHFDGGGNQVERRLESLQQENKVLKMELDAFKIKCKNLQEENRELKKNSVLIQARAEQEEEMISNTLMKKINELKKEKEMLAHNYEQEEECLTNELSRRLNKLRQEKLELERTLEREQEHQVSKLMKRIDYLEADISGKQQTLEQLRREKVELENALEAEQEGLVNRLWKRMEKLEAEKRSLQSRLDQPVSEPPSPRDPSQQSPETAAKLVRHIHNLRAEVGRLKKQLSECTSKHKTDMARLTHDERLFREENLRLQRKLQLEMDRREALCRHLSESESSLEMDDERLFNEMSKQHEALHTRHCGISSPSTQDSTCRPPRSHSPCTLRCERCGASVYSAPLVQPGSSRQRPSALLTCSRTLPTSSVTQSGAFTCGGISPGSQVRFVKPAAPDSSITVAPVSPGRRQRSCSGEQMSLISK